MLVSFYDEIKGIEITIGRTCQQDSVGRRAQAVTRAIFGRTIPSRRSDRRQASHLVTIFRIRNVVRNHTQIPRRIIQKELTITM
jgi:hypothetical protein